MRPGVARTMLALAAAGACRDATEPFASNDRPRVVHAEPRQLTFSPMDDRSPTWNAAGDSVYYSGYSEDLLPGAPATLLSVALEGGIARPVLQNAQVGSNRQRWFVAPAREPGGERIAFVDLEPINPFWLCPWPQSKCAREGGPLVEDAIESPRLVAARLRVRAPSATGRLEDDPRLSIDLRSHEDTILANGFEAYRTHYPPFQEDYIDSRSYPFRPAWSPDGGRIAVSDGLHVLMWDPASGVLDTVPGTNDGLAPAWSPDGSSIAFMWIERLEPIDFYCEFGFEDTTVVPPVWEPHCMEWRTRYVLAPARVVTISPDGAGRTVVADGRDPVWLPDGRLLFAGRLASPPEPLRIYDPDDGSLTLLLGTEGGAEPALSPDGQWLAYSRWTGTRTGPRNIYAVRLD